MHSTLYSINNPHPIRIYQYCQQHDKTNSFTEHTVNPRPKVANSISCHDCMRCYVKAAATYYKASAVQPHTSPLRVC